MNRTLITLAAAAGLAFAVPAFADDSAKATGTDKVERGSDGSYSEKGSTSSENTDANGTYTSTEKSVKDKTDANGNGKKVVKTKTVRDPKGLNNKTKTTTTDTTTTKDGSVENEHEKVVNGTTVEKTDTKEQQ